jgi:hypothetical protein
VDALRQGRYLLARVAQGRLLAGGLLSDSLAQDLGVVDETEDGVGDALLQPGFPVGVVVAGVRAGVPAAPVPVADVVKVDTVFSCGP